jgi:hypothetical protein
MTKLFASHCAADIALIRQVQQHAKPLGIAIYAYEDDPRGGSVLADKLTQEIRASDAVIVLLTKNSALRPSVHTEVGIARTLGKPIIPVLEAGVNPLEFVFLQGIEFITLDDGQDESAVHKLQMSMKRVQDSVRAHASTIGAVLVLLGIIFLLWAHSQRKTG